MKHIDILIDDFFVTELSDLGVLVNLASDARSSGESVRWQKARIAAAVNLNGVEIIKLLKKNPDLSYDEIQQFISDASEVIMDKFNWKNGAFYKAAKLGRWIKPSEVLDDFSYNDHLELAYFEPPVRFEEYDNHYDFQLAWETARLKDKEHREGLVREIREYEAENPFESLTARAQYIKATARRFRDHIREGKEADDYFHELSAGYKEKKATYVVESPNDIEDFLDILSNMLQASKKFYMNITYQIPNAENTESEVGSDATDTI